MHNRLEDSTQAKARELARKITVAHDLDPEIQEELYGHIEDKLLAYKSGEERMTDEDALILVREHFGDARTLKGLFQDVHREEVENGLLRRLLVAAITTLVWVQGGAWLAHIADFSFNTASPTVLPGYYAAKAVAAVAFLLPFLCFVRWERRMRRGESVWFSPWRTPALAAMATAFFGTSLVVPGFWAPLLEAAEIPYFLHMHLLQRFPPHNPSEYAYLPTAFILSNLFLFAIMIWCGMNIETAHREHKAGGRGSRSLRVLYLWSIIALLGVADLFVLGLPEGFTSHQSPAVYLFTLAVWSVIVLAFCSSWVWWCDTPPRLTRNTAKVALFWSGFIFIYSALPRLQAGLALGESAPALGGGTTWFKLDLPGTNIWLYLARPPHDLLYQLSVLPTLATFAVFFAVIVTLTYRIMSGKHAVEIAGE